MPEKKTKTELEEELNKTIKKAEEEEQNKTIKKAEEEEQIVEEEDESPELKPKLEENIYKKKFSESAKENQKIYAKNRKLNQAIDEAAKISPPLDEEMMVEYPDWDLMSDIEKKLAKEIILSKKFRKKIVKAREEGAKIDKWHEEVEAFLDNPQTLIDYPELEGKTDEFKVFTTEETNNSVPFKILVSSFLYETKKTQSQSPAKQQMFESGSGGKKELPIRKSDKLSIDEAAELMKNDYRKYKELLLAGKLDISEVK